MKKEKIFEEAKKDWKLRKELHKAWFFGNGQKLVLFYSEKEGFSWCYVSVGWWFAEEPPDLVGWIFCCEHENIDITPYEEGVGIYNDEVKKWEWNPIFPYKEDYPNPPSWEDIIIASIETGDWQDWEDEMLKKIFFQD